MPEVNDWLSLKVQAGLKPAPALLMSVPKKKIRLAVERNRIKRLLREAFRHAGRLEAGKEYQFLVTKDPGGLGLEEVKRVMAGLIR